MGLQDPKITIGVILSKARRIAYLCNEIAAYGYTSDELIDAINRLDVDKVKEFLLKLKARNLETMTFEQLRMLAARLKVKDYSRKRKWELIGDLERVITSSTSV